MKKVTEPGYEIQVGDKVEKKSPYGTDILTINKVTPKYAFANAESV